MRRCFDYWLLPLLFTATLTQAQPDPPKPGSEFQSKENRALEADDFAHPGMLWVEQGAKLWRDPRGTAQKSCADCHGDAKPSMRGVAASYPKHDANIVLPSPDATEESLRDRLRRPGEVPRTSPSRKVLNLEQRINLCVTENQKAPALPHESRELLSLTTYVAHQSKGMPIKVNVEGNAQATFERGKALYFQRVGQMNLACTHCHDQNWGKTLLAESVSQGQPDGWPAYRLEWQTVGSLQRRLRACFFGVRAEQPAFGSDDLVALELYLAKRAEGLPVAVPGVRR